MFVVMRTYFEKPRTVGGWKGLILDPKMDGSYDIGGVSPWQGPCSLKLQRSGFLSL
jgi:hypothetical protein